MTDKYQAYLGIEFETDTVKKIHLPEMRKDMPLYMVSLIEHKSDVDYNVCMQLLRYTVCIWDDYAKTMEKAHPGISKTKGSGIRRCSRLCIMRAREMDSSYARKRTGVYE